MGLVLQEVRTVVELLRKTEAPHRVLSLGHPDILATPDELESVVGVRLGIDNESVLADRNGYADPGIVGSAKLVFAAVGATLDAVDKRASFGVTECLDLNEPLPVRYQNRYSLVIDPGTTEHIFNVGQALLSVAGAVCEGGYVYHMVPLASWNHGFWNFSPLVFSQFYSERNGFELVQLNATRHGKDIAVEPVAKFKIENNGFKLNLMCIAKKIRQVEVLEFPNQMKWA